MIEISWGWGWGCSTKKLLTNVLSWIGISNCEREGGGQVCIFFGTTHFILERCVWGSNHKIFTRRGTDVLGKIKISTCNVLMFKIISIWKFWLWVLHWTWSNWNETTLTTCSITNLQCDQFSGGLQISRELYTGKILQRTQFKSEQTLNFFTFLLLQLSKLRTKL